MYLSLQEVLRPTAIEACLDLLQGPDTAALGGGTWLSASAHERVVRLVDLQALPIREMTVRGPELRLGALVRLSEIAGATWPAGATALVQAATAEHNLPIRNQSTVGGRVARRRADGRIATALMALGAEVEVAGANGTSRVGLSDLLRTPAAQGGGPLIVALVVPTLPEASTYAWFGRTAIDAPMADAGAARMADGSFLLASGGHGLAGEGVVSLRKAAAVAAGIVAGAATDSWWSALHAAALEELPSFSDMRASGDWRQDVGATLVCRAVQTLIGEGGAA